MVDLLIKNGLIVTMDKDHRIISDGAVGIEEGRIVSVKRSWKGRGKPEEVINAHGKIVMPGLICSHTHSYRVFLRNAPLKVDPPTDFTQTLQRVWWPMEEVVTKEDAYASAAISCLEFIKTGCTLFADTFSGTNTISGVLDRVATAIEQSGMRGIISFGATERHTHAEGSRGVKENERFILKNQKERAHRVRGMFSVQNSFTVSNELFRYVRELANKYKVPVSIHASEGLADLYHNYEHFGKRTIERLKDVEFLGPDVVLTHCVHVNDDELAIIKKTGAKVAHNPMSNMLNAVGVAPIVKMHSMEIPVGLGNDGYIFDSFDNIRMVFLLHKLARGDPSAMPSREALEMATIRGAQLYGLENELGSIETGKLADIIIIDPKRSPTPVYPENVIDHIVNTVTGDDVETVIVGGNVLMRERKMLSMEKEEVIKMSRKSAERIWHKLGAIKKR